MLTLTPLEVAELKRACGDVEHEYSWHQPTVDSLVARGYIVTWEDGEWDYVKTTPKGELALRCHAAMIGARA
jgi:predicted transcriptional regulator